MLPAIGGHVVYTQPAHEEPFEGRREHMAIVKGYGSTRFDNALTVEVAFLASAQQLPREPDESDEAWSHRVVEDQIKRSYWIEKIDVTPDGEDKGVGTWAPMVDGPLTPPEPDTINLGTDATG